MTIKHIYLPNFLCIINIVWTYLETMILLKILFKSILIQFSKTNSHKFMLPLIYISSKFCSFELSIKLQNPEKMNHSFSTVFNVECSLGEYTRLLSKILKTFADPKLLNGSVYTFFFLSISFFNES